MKYLVIFLVLTGLGGAGGAYAGFCVGKYYTTQNFQKVAVAYECGSYKVDLRGNLTYTWRVPLGVQMAANEVQQTNALKGR